MSPELVDLIGLAVGAVLTLLIFSYALGDNPLYRLALHLFVGVVVGYAFGIAMRVILTNLLDPLLIRGERLAVVPAILAVLLLIKGLQRYAYLGNVSIAYLLGVGAAVALSGALLGTAIPQVGATGRAIKVSGLCNGPLIIVGTLSTLMLFTFTARQQHGLGKVWARAIAGISWVGRGFLVVALGVAFAGAVTAALSVLIGRVQYLIDFVLRLFGG